TCPSPIIAPTANSSDSAGTTIPTTTSESRKAIRKITAPAATGCALIQARMLSNQASFIAQLWTLQCGHDGSGGNRGPGAEGRQLRPHLADARSGRRVRAPGPAPRAAVAAAAGVVAGAARGARGGTGARDGRRAAAAGLGRTPAGPQLHGRRGHVPAAAARRPGVLPRRPPPAAGAAPARRC